jgi:histidinol-phosphate aminotransferase
VSEVDALLRPDLRGRTPYGAPQLDVAVRLNTNENPHPPSSELVAELSAAVGEAARAMNRYPDRDALALRADLADYLTRSTGQPLDVEQVWAANGSNEVLQQLLMAFGGPGRTALGFDPTYSMHRLISEGTGTTWAPMPRLPGFRLEPEQAALVVREHAPDVVFLCSPNNPTGTALDLDVVEAVYAAAQSLVVVDEAYAGVLDPSVGGRPAAGPAPPRGDPHDVQGLRLRRGPPRLPRGRPGGGRGPAARPAALPPVGAHPGRPHALRWPEPTSCSRRWQRSSSSGTGCCARSRRWGSRSSSRTRTSCCSASSATRRPPGRVCWTAACWCATWAWAGWLRVTAGTEAETTAFLDALREGLSTTETSEEVDA